MNVNQKIIKALSFLSCPVKPDRYSGKEKMWVTFHYADEQGGLFADNEAGIETAYLQIHLFTPEEKNVMELKKKIKKKLVESGFTYPQVSSFLEEETGIRHTVFECAIAQFLE